MFLYNWASYPPALLANLHTWGNTTAELLTTFGPTPGVLNTAVHGLGSSVFPMPTHTGFYGSLYSSASTGLHAPAHGFQHLVDPSHEGDRHHLSSHVRTPMF